MLPETLTVKDHVLFKHCSRQRNSKSLPAGGNELPQRCFPAHTDQWDILFLGSQQSAIRPGQSLAYVAISYASHSDSLGNE